MTNKNLKHLSESSKTDIKPVFILGIRHRSGTNMLLNALVQHKNCVAHNDPEDFLVSPLRNIQNYTTNLQKRRKSKKNRKNNQKYLNNSIGNTLLSYLIKEIDPTTIKSNNPTRVITKTPSVEGLKYFREFFPDTHLIIIIRDGRSIIESAIKSFNANFENGCQRYVSASNDIISFLENDKNPNRTKVIKFEDYIKFKKETVISLLDFLNLSTDDYPFENLDDLPVHGSSELNKNSENKIHWEPMAMDKKFNPINRHANWSKFQLNRFEWVAGNCLETLGYQRSNQKNYYFYPINLLLDIFSAGKKYFSITKLRSILFKYKQ